MASKLKSLSKSLNPNWAQLLEKLKTSGSKHSRRSNEETQRSILGKRQRQERSDEDSVAGKPNPLIPTSSDCSVTDVVAMDCEMVGVSSQGNKSALGRVTLVNKWGNVIYDEYVRPVEYVVDFRTQISGIRPHDLRKAKNFNVAQKKVAEVIKGRIIVGHALRNDLKALLLSHPKTDIRDTAEYAPYLKDGRSRSLKKLAAEFLNVEIQNGEHCPIEDARAAMMLYQKNRKQWEKSVKDLKRLMKKQKRRKHKKKPRGVEESGEENAVAVS
ncbi:RNA exonuclease 4 [Andrographis paniculata]|uniref:RNA exonuclease 4 n=1 Tax=Andrographis paniculata TaxID=175694 RepID=UPI0021E717D4|nr:RNA exonuclease 4 [Andrographis paniculata]